MRFLQGLLSPVERVDDVVLIADVPGVLSDETAELNAAEEETENEKDRENAETNFTSPRRKYYTAQRRLRDHSQKRKDESRFDNFQQFAFETAVRLIAFRLTDNL